MGTALIGQGEVLAALDMREALGAVEEIFRLHGQKKVQMPSKVYLELPRGDLRAMPAYAPTLGFAAIKNINMHDSPPIASAWSSRSRPRRSRRCDRPTS